MNLLRKIGKWCWGKKERMVLGILLVFLVYRLYTVWKVTDKIEFDQFAQPSKTYNGESYEEPPRVDTSVEEVDLAMIKRRPIFIWEPPGRRGKGNEALNEEDQKLRVIRIIEKDDGNHLAQISTGGKKTLLREGESFESYELVSIDIGEETDSVVIYSENSNSNITIEVEK